jgi:hypothetical protein
MRVFRAIGRVIAWLWAFSRRSWIDTGIGLRPRSGASALVLFLFLILFPIGLVLVLLGFDFGDVDAWLERQSGWLDAVGTLLFRGIAGFTLLMCVLLVVSAVVDRKSPDRIHLGCLPGIAILAYFAWIAMTMEY